MFHFVLYGLKLSSDDIININDNPNEQSVYVLLCLEYFRSFLSSTFTIPQLQFNVLSTISNQKQYRSARSV